MDPSSATVLKVLTRDECCCVRCGKWVARGPRGYAWSIQHRRPRGAGGDRDPNTNRTGNLIVLCGSATTGCHGWVEQHRTDEDKRYGWLISRYATPTATPVRHALHGWVLLDNHGHYQPTSVPRGAEAA